MAVILRDVGSIISLQQSVLSRPKGLFAGNTFSPFQTVKVSPYYLAVVNQLRMQQSPFCDTSILNLTVSQSLSFIGSAFKVLPVDAISYFFPYFVARSMGASFTTQTFSISQAAIAERSRTTRNALSVTQLATLIANRTLPPTNTLIIRSNAVGYKLSRNFIAIEVITPTPPGGDDGHCD